MFKTIVKRDGKVVKFNSAKITDAISKAGNCTKEFDATEAQKLTDEVIKRAEKKVSDKPTVEQIQDTVEEVLLDSKYKKTAKQYITYRQERTRVRNTKTQLMQTYKMIACADAKDDSDVKRGNANVDGDSAMGKMLQFWLKAVRISSSFLMKPEHTLLMIIATFILINIRFWATST